MKKEEDKKTNIHIVNDMYEHVKNLKEDKFLKITICEDNESIFNSIMKKIKNIYHQTHLRELERGQKTALREGVYPTADAAFDAACGALRKLI